MENEEVKQVDSGAKDVGDATNYIEAIKEMKANSVDRRAYEKLMADNKALLDAIVNGKEVAAAAAAPKEPVNVQKLREELFSAEADFSNLDYVKRQSSCGTRCWSRRAWTVLSYRKADFAHGAGRGGGTAVSRRAKGVH